VWKKYVVGGHVTVTVKAKGIRTRIRRPLRRGLKIILIVNNQFTDTANSTQIASGAGRSSASGSNAAIASSNTGQQQSVGAGGTASNSGMEGTQSEPHRKRCKHACHHKRRSNRNRKHIRNHKHRSRRLRKKEDILIVLNNQVHESNGDSASSATQLASGGKDYSAGGTNAAIESSNTKQQHGVGGGTGAQASNSGLNSDQVGR
jgi:hypothetical protein